MAYKFDSTTFNADVQPAHTLVTIGFDLVDDAVIDPGTGKPTVLASTTCSCNVSVGSTTAQAKTQIAEACVGTLQTWYNTWVARKTKITDWLSSNEATLESYVNSHVTF